VVVKDLVAWRAINLERRANIVVLFALLLLCCLLAVIEFSRLKTRMFFALGNREIHSAAIGWVVGFLKGKV
jgi:hypothetical protein